jgi:two-component system, OmpR family, phosphate regulon response regulator PhoB
MLAEPSIMIADDDADLLFLLKKQFEKAGFNISVCLNGVGLIKELLKKKIKLVLLDISMGAVSGSNLCKQIRADKRVKDVKIVMMSGNADIEQIATHCGADGFVPKPINIERVREVISGFSD